MGINLFAVISAAIVGEVIHGVPPLERGVSQILNNEIPNELLEPADLLELALRAGGSGELAVADIKAKTGLDEGRISQLFSLKQQMAQIGQLINVYKSGGLDFGGLLDKGKKLGWTEGDINLLVKASMHAPSPQDIVRYGDFGVYGGGGAGDGNTGGDMPSGDAADKDLLFAGIDAGTFGKLWNSHWNVPAFQEAINLRHRGYMSDGDLNALLSYAAIHPRFRGAMIGGIYNPISILQLNRLIKYKIITSQDATGYLKKLGYDETDAGLLTEMFVKMNSNPLTQEMTNDEGQLIKHRDISREDVIGGYKDGMFTSDEAHHLLKDLGFDDQEIEYFMTRADYEVSKAIIDKEINYYRDAYVTGFMAFNDVSNGLNGLNLDATHISALFKMWDLDKKIRFTRPTKSELLAFYRKGIITVDELTAELQGLKYPQKYIEWFVESVTSGTAQSSSSEGS